MSVPTSESLTVRVLFWLAGALYDHRRWFFYPQVLLTGLAVFYTVEKLEFLTSRDALVGGDKKYHRDYLRYKKEFPVQDDLVVVVESASTEKNRQFVERLGAKLGAETNWFTSVFYKGDLKLMGPKALLFLPEKDLEDLLHTFQEYKPFLLQFTKATNLVSLVDLVNTQFRTARREENEQNKALVKALPALQRIVEQAADALARPGNPPSPGVNALFEGGKEAEQQMYVTFGNGRVFLLTAQAPSEDLNEKAVQRMRQLITATQVEVPGINVGLTGEPVLEVDEMQQSQRDTTVASIVSLIVVALIFIYGYHETGRPIKATLCLLVGLAYTMGFTTLTVGHLNILTITFAPILIGLAIDFGVHLISRYEEELRRGRTERYALEKAIVYTGMGIFTGAFTTAGAFFAMALTDFKGIKEMGIICGGGMLVCLVPMMTLLPVLLLRGKQNVLDHELGPVLDRQAAAEFERRARIENIWLGRPAYVIALILVLSALALVPARRVRFDYNLLHMQSAGLPAVIFQDKLIQSSTNRSVLFAAVVANSLTNAPQLISSITNLPSVGGVDSMIEYLTEDQTRKLALLGEVKKVAAQIRFEPLDEQPANTAELDRSLFSLHGYCGLAVKELKSEPDSSTFSTNDILDLRSLAAKLRSASSADKLSQYLWSQLSPATREDLSRYHDGPDLRLQQALVDDLNRLVRSGPIYETQRFQLDSLSADARSMVSANLQGPELASLNRTLLQEGYPLELAKTLFQQVLSLQEAVSGLRSRLLMAKPEAASHKLAEFQQALFKDVRDTFASIRNQDDTGRLTASDLPAALRSRFVGVTGKYLIQVYPKKDIWGRAEQEEFITQLRDQIDKDVTGTPIQLYEYTGLLRKSFEEAARYSLVAIAILVFIHFRSLPAVILSLLPVAFGSMWMVGIMGLFGIPFNPANVMTLPLIIGIGVTNGIHILNRFAEENHPSILARSTGKAVLVSGLTAIAGFGSLILAQHRGIRSLGLIMSTGITTCMIVGLTFVPAILNLLSKRGWTIQKQKNPARQCTVDAGSGGTEVTTSSMDKK